ncbi:hypothetical protein MPTK1_4g09010 [Marchantia polymorpha subsp. ruderalis]|uniref:Uncharacterized protein n=2 Tax=Marchantia polymorpha TaxID=3197 RepID=A0AAF6B7Y2_MARPO|nr:hypothetical protein MARPO_0112s0003 [Marchantia polymorpha]BBN08116.1 hypothetical protein Mp_4g09010 [Marchantia polymorpha subsp. ruderalis]|eukprot:PTQ31342.1 hypothetical protein MARPO_0112s0003 [Marchantia polymorpha]
MFRRRDNILMARRGEEMRGILCRVSVHPKDSVRLLDFEIYKLLSCDRKREREQSADLSQDEKNGEYRKTIPSFTA